MEDLDKNLTTANSFGRPEIIPILNCEFLYSVLCFVDYLLFYHGVLCFVIYNIIKKYKMFLCMIQIRLST